MRPGGSGSSATTSSFSTTSRAPRLASTARGSRACIPSPVHRRRRPRRRRRSARALEEPFDAVLHLAGQVAVTTSILDPVTDYDINALGTFKLLEELRRRHAERPGPGAAPDLRLDQQGLRPPLHGRDPARRPLGLPEPSGGRLRGGVALLRVPLRLLEGRGRPVRRRLPPQLRPSDRRDAPVVHLRAPPVRRGRPGLGGVVRARRDLRPADHLLRRRPPGARPPVGRRPRGAVSRRPPRKRATVAGRAYNVGGGPGFRLSLKELLGISRRA